MPALVLVQEPVLPEVPVVQVPVEALAVAHSSEHLAGSKASVHPVPCHGRCHHDSGTGADTGIAEADLDPGPCLVPGPRLNHDLVRGPYPVLGHLDPCPVRSHRDLVPGPCHGLDHPGLCLVRSFHHPGRNHNPGQGHIHDHHAREGITWRRDEVNSWSLLRDQYYWDLDGRLRRVPAPGDGMARVIRKLYLAHW